MENYIFDDQTGNTTFPPRLKNITVNMGAFSAILQLTEDDKFVGIVEISEKKDFMSIDQKLSMPQGYHDVDKFYEDSDSK